MEAINISYRFVFIFELDNCFYLMDLQTSIYFNFCFIDPILSGTISPSQSWF